MKKYFAELVGTFILVFFGVGRRWLPATRGRHSRHRLCVRAGADRRGVWHWPDLGLPHQPGGEPGGVHGWTDVVEGHARLLGGAVCWARSWQRGLSMSIASGVAGGYDLATQRAGAGWMGRRATRAATIMTSAILFEFVATLIFVIVILGSTQKSAPAGFAGLAIGITLVVIHICGHPHYGREREPGPEPWTGAAGGRQGDGAGVAVPAGSERGRGGGGVAVPDQGAGSRLERSRSECFQRRQASWKSHPFRRYPPRRSGKDGALAVLFILEWEAR